MFNKAKDLTGVRSGRVVATFRQGTNDRGHALWSVMCDCGGSRVVPASFLVKGAVKSCGCTPNPGNITHQQSGTPTYNSWRAMKERVGSSNNSHFRSYGGRGIGICDSWRLFENFLADMGERPEGTTLDRRRVNEGYSLGNCRWSTRVEQSRNTTRSIRIEFQGETMVKKDWAIRLGITEEALSYRLRKWPKERAMTASRSSKHLGALRINNETSEGNA